MDGEWSAWSRQVSMTNPETITLAPGVIPANSGKDVVITSAQPITVGTLPILVLYSNIFTLGISYACWFNTTDSKLYVRFTNTTNSDITINLVGGTIGLIVQ